MPRRLQQNDGRNHDAPLVEVFGSTLALLIIIFILVNQIVSEDIRAMLDRSTEGAEYKVSWSEGGEGYVVISYEGSLHIIETQESVSVSNLCNPDSAFIPYISQIYSDSSKQQLIFAIVENGVKTMAVARNCMRSYFGEQPISIGWIIASKDLLSNVRLQELPARIKRALEPR